MESGMTTEFSSLAKKITKIAVFGSSFAFLATSAACGSSSSPSAPTAAPDASEDPIAVLDAQQGVTPCKNINSGFPGDEYCMEPPPADKGFQFHYGPADYTNKDEVAKYTLQPGQEVTDCVFFPTPNDTEVYFNEYHSRMRPGSHHMLLYIQASPLPETGPDDAPGQCDLAGQVMSTNLFGAQSQTLDTKGLGNGSPENDGMAVRIPAKQQGIMQVHFINAGTKPILREAWANVLYVDKSQVTQLGDPIFFIAGVTMNVKKGQTVVIHGSAPVPASAESGFRLIAATPHYHTHTSRFTVTATIAGQTQTILDNFPTMHALPEPQLTAYNSTTKNALPNAAGRVDGATSGILNLQPGDHIDWDCTITNDDQPNPITFANAVYTGEMCNLFGLYGPSIGGPWSAPNL
jgi:hypothetical protein